MDLAGKKVGWIRIEKPLGSGGMGSVYKGFHEKLKRPVAVKTIQKDGRIKDITRARFLREARTLSSLDHPNICQIYDYMEEDDFDLLVLELIEGESLAQVMAKPLSRGEKFRIAKQLTLAIAAAHAKGIVHRDIKPENVMITPEGVLKVLDFGLSRTEVGGRVSIPPEGDAGLTLDTDHPAFQIKTQHGILMGTLLYMSPEQAKGEQATAASDVYALGLLFQELFTGRPALQRGNPFALTLRLAATGQTEEVEGLDEPLTRFINRLKSYVPEARPGAQDALDRLTYLANAPNRKRKRMLAWTTAAGLLIFALTMGWQSMRIRAAVKLANDAAEKARQSAETADEVSDFLISLFQQLDPATSQKPISPRELLDLGTDRLSTMSSQPLSKARLMATMAGIYRHLGVTSDALPLAEEALEIRSKLLPEHHKDIADSLNLLARIYQDQDRFEDALTAANKALYINETLFGDNDLVLANQLMVIAEIHKVRVAYAQALPIAERALNIREDHLPEDHFMVGEALSLYGTCLDYAGDDEGAEKILIRAINVLEKSPNRLALADAVNNLGKVYSQTMQLEASLSNYLRSLELTTELLGPINPRTGDLYNNIAIVYVRQRDHANAIKNYTRSLEIYRKVYSGNHSNISKALGNLANSYIDTGDFQQAVVLAREAYENHKASVGEAGGGNAYYMLVYAQALTGLGRYPEARRFYRDALLITRKYEGANSTLIGANLETLAWMMQEGSQNKDAILLFQSAAKLWASLPKPDYEALIYNSEDLIELYRKEGMHEDLVSMERKLDEYRRKRDDNTGI